MVGPDHLQHEGLPGGVLEGVVDAQQRGQDADLPDRTVPVTVSKAEHEGLDAHRALQDDHEPALVDPVGDDAAVGAEEQHGRVCSATTRPSAVLECVRVRTSQDWAVICIQVPIREIDWPLIVAAVVGDRGRRRSPGRR